MTQTIEWTWGDQIRKARMTAGMDQQQLANAVGVSRPLVSKWENGKAVPSVAHYKRIAVVTNVDLLMYTSMDAA